jgi:hypothetical protein
MTLASNRLDEQILTPKMGQHLALIVRPPVTVSFEFKSRAGRGDMRWDN